MTKDEAIELLEDLDGAIEDNHGRDYDEAFRMAIESLSADKVEVVQCYDCRWWNSETKGCKRNPSVEAWHKDDFCNYGKRWSNAIDKG